MESRSSLKEHLHQLEIKLLKPEIRTSPEELSKLLADEFFEFGSSGNVWYKKDGIGEEGIGIVEVTLSNFEIHLLSDDIVLATYRIFNKINLQYTLRSSIWKLIDGNWNLFFHQGTKTNSLL
jgi:hypothetical protein